MDTLTVDALRGVACALRIEVPPDAGVDQILAIMAANGVSLDQETVETGEEADSETSDDPAEEDEEYKNNQEEDSGNEEEGVTAVVRPVSVDYRRLTCAQLRELCSQHKLETSGKKDDLVDRLLNKDEDVGSDTASCKWTKLKNKVHKKAFRGPKPGPKFEPGLLKTEKDFFFSQLSETFWQEVVKQTNLYAEQKMKKSKTPDKKPQKVNIDQLYAFLAVVIRMGMLPAKSASMYWQKDGTCNVPSITQVMSRNLFQWFMAHLHLANNEEIPVDKPCLYKVQRMIDELNIRARKCYNPTVYVVIDEGMMATKSPLSGFRIYMKDKPVKWGIKVWMLVDENGYLYGFFIYTGRKGNRNETHHGLGAHVVTELVKLLPKKLGRVSADDLSTSLGEDYVVESISGEEEDDEEDEGDAVPNEEDCQASSMDIDSEEEEEELETTESEDFESFGTSQDMPFDEETESESDSVGYKKSDGAGYVAVADNYFSSVALAKELEKGNTNYIGTIRKTRKGFGEIEWKKDIKSRGDFEYFTDENHSQLSAHCWMDSKLCYFISNCHTAGATSSYEKIVKKQGSKDATILTIVMPLVAKEYREKMGAVDKFNRCVSLYLTKRFSRRWWMVIFFYILDYAIVNAWILYCLTVKKVEQLVFRKALAKALAGDSKVQKIRRAFPSKKGSGMVNYNIVKKIEKGGRTLCLCGCKGKATHTCILCEQGLLTDPSHICGHMSYHFANGDISMESLRIDE